MKGIGKVRKILIAALIAVETFLLAGCAGKGVRQDAPDGGKEGPVQIRSKLDIPTLQVSIVPLEYEGVITDMKGKALLLNANETAYKSIGIGDKIPFGRILNTKAKTIIEMTMPTGEKAFIYSQEKESWFKIERVEK